MSAILQTTFCTHFIERKCLYFDPNLTYFFPKSPTNSIDSDTGLVPNMRQASI